MTSLVIPCYFVDESFIKMTQRCLKSLKYGRPDEVILVDDGSPMNIPKYSKLFPEADRHIIRKNGGFAAAVNSGLRWTEGDILIISNNDITFAPGWLDAILKPLYEEWDISSIRVSDSDGWETEDKITDGDWFGSLWAMKREVYEKIGGLDETFGRGTFEDKDYARRAIEAGFKIAKNHSVVVEHVGRATFDVVDPTHTSFEKNKKIYEKKWKSLD